MFHSNIYLEAESNVLIYCLEIGHAAIKPPVLLSLSLQSS